MTATRGTCTILVGVASLGQEMIPHFRATAEGGDVQFGYSGRWSVEAPGLWSAFDMYLEQRLPRLGLSESWPPLIAVAEKGECPNPGTIIDGLRIWPAQKHNA